MAILTHLNFEKVFEPGVGSRLRLKDTHQHKNKKYMLLLFKLSNSKNFVEIQQIEAILNQLEFNLFNNDQYVGFAQCLITPEVIEYVNMGNSFNLSNKVIELVLFGDKVIMASLRPNTAEHLKNTIIDIIKKNNPNYIYQQNNIMNHNVSRENMASMAMAPQNMIHQTNLPPVSNFIFNRNVLPPLQSINMYPRQIKQISRGGVTNDLMTKLAGPNAEEEIAPEINNLFKVTKDRIWLTENYR